MEIYYYHYHISNYDFTIAASNDYLIFLTKDKETLDYIYQENSILRKIKEELTEYFKGVRKSFDIPIKLEGTVFQKQVWEEMQKVSYGKTICYQELARAALRPKACRAVGNICHNNPIMIIIPCHRITAKNGLGGFGKDIGFKVALLELEKATLNKK